MGAGRSASRALGEAALSGRARASARNRHPPRGQVDHGSVAVLEPQRPAVGLSPSTSRPRRPRRNPARALARQSRPQHDRRAEAGPDLLVRGDPGLVAEDRGHPRSSARLAPAPGRRTTHRILGDDDPQRLNVHARSCTNCSAADGDGRSLTVGRRRRGRRSSAIAPAPRRGGAPTRRSPGHRARRSSRSSQGRRWSLRRRGRGGRTFAASARPIPAPRRSALDGP